MWVIFYQINEIYNSIVIVRIIIYSRLLTIRYGSLKISFSKKGHVLLRELLQNKIKYGHSSVFYLSPQRVEPKIFYVEASEDVM